MNQTPPLLMTLFHVKKRQYVYKMRYNITKKGLLDGNLSSTIPKQLTIVKAVNLSPFYI